MKYLPRTGQKILFVATNFTDPNLAQKINNGVHPRVDYFDLTAQTGGEFIDYGATRPNPFLQQIENRLNLDFRLAATVVKKVIQEGFTTVVSFSERVGIPLALMLPEAIKHLVIQHHPLSKKKLLIEKLFRVHQHWAYVIAISRAEKDALRVKLNLPPERIFAIHCPVDTDFFSPQWVNEYSGQEDHIESLGLSHRDYPTLIRAMQMLPNIRCNFRVGSYWVTRKFGFKPNQLPPNIEIQPFVSPDILRTKIAQSRFIIVPIRNYTQWSAGCTTVQIAQAMGKAVIATDLPGLRDYVAHNETGILVRPGDSNAMADAIRSLWMDPERALQMGRQGSAFMKENFSMDLYIQKLKHLLYH